IAGDTTTRDDQNDLASRLVEIYTGLQEQIERFQPTSAAVEETVVNKNAASSLKLGQARGVTLLAAAHGHLMISEYASKTVKRAVAGTGAATKSQVIAMVQVLLPRIGKLPSDAADALAIAICHAHHAETAAKLSYGTR
ncbi:MAG: crossover junction endodeoxyribonuclease RuvC, partial [Pseudomonadota bacterium]